MYKFQYKISILNLLTCANFAHDKKIHILNQIHQSSNVSKKSIVSYIEDGRE